MTKQNNHIMKIFSSNGNKGQFGSWQQNNPNLVNDPESIQSLQAWDKGWKNAVIGNGSPPLEENNAILYVLSQSIAYLKQQGSIGMEWNTDTTYYNGSMVSKIASSALLGSDTSKITLVYRSLEDDNIGNTLPNDFISDDHWAFVDAVQPQNLNKLDFTGAIGSINQFDADETAVPINWGICDGRVITMPDGTTQNTPDLRDRFLISASDDKEKGTTGGRWIGDTGAHKLTEAELAKHHHTYTAYNKRYASYQTEPRYPFPFYDKTGDTNSVGGDQPHIHENTDFTNPYYSVYYIRRMF